LWFDSYRSFEVAVDRLTAEADLRQALGEAGCQYTSRYYRWPSIIGRYTEFLSDTIARGRRVPLRTTRLEIPTGGLEYVRGG
jgi:glycosyltransferase involved in cell wall biosynthesis